jgi:hypothetical protein
VKKTEGKREEENELTRTFFIVYLLLWRNKIATNYQLNLNQAMCFVNTIHYYLEESC